MDIVSEKFDLIVARIRDLKFKMSLTWPVYSHTFLLPATIWYEKKNHRGQEITLKRSEAREWKRIPRLANVNDKTIINHTYEGAKPMWTGWIIFKFENMQQNTGRTSFRMIVFYNIAEEKKNMTSAGELTCRRSCTVWINGSKSVNKLQNMHHLQTH